MPETVVGEVVRVTFENEEKTYGVDDCLQLADLAPVVLDIHHCWINENDYIEVDDPRSRRADKLQIGSGSY